MYALAHLNLSTVIFKCLSYKAHICFTLIIYKQFNFWPFNASAYTNVDRLCTVFLYNICRFREFIEYAY